MSNSHLSVKTISSRTELRDDSVGVIVVDTDERVVSWNVAAEEFIEAVGRMTLRLGLTLEESHPAQARPGVARMLEALRAGRAFPPKLVGATDGSARRYRVRYEALTSDGVFAGVAQVIEPLLETTVAETIARRRSIRHFTDRVPDPTLVRRIVEAGRLAPSAANIQPTRVVIADTAKSLTIVRSAAYGIGAVSEAPVVLVLLADLDADAQLGERMAELTRSGTFEATDVSKLVSGAGRPFELRLGESVALINTAVAGAYIELAAASRGLGTCWVHHADHSQISDELGLPANLKVVSLLALGYPAEEPDARPRLDCIEWPSDPRA